MLKKLKALAIKVLRQLNDWTNIIIYLSVVLLFFSPSIIAFIIPHPATIAFALTYLAFWAGPFTPAIPIQLAATFGLRALLNKLFPALKKSKPIFKRKNKKEASDGRGRAETPECEGQSGPDVSEPKE